jgi:hypothetical protein
MNAVFETGENREARGWWREWKRRAIARSIRRVAQRPHRAATNSRNDPSFATAPVEFS